MFTLSAILILFFLFGASALTAVSSSLHRLGRLQSEEELKSGKSRFFFRKTLPFFFGQHKWEGLLFSLSFTKHFLRICFVLSSLFLLDLYVKPPFDLHETLFFSLVIIVTSLIFDFLFSLFGQLKPKIAFHILGPIASLILLICIPLTAPFFKLMKIMTPIAPREKIPNFRIRDKVEELLQETELGAYLDTTEKKLVLSVVSFKERIAREVMVPRINVFSLPDDMPIQEAAQIFPKEGYSRIPVYKDTVDNIIGVLLYKDILKIFIERETAPHLLSQPIAKIVKPVLYTPETKKISQLLQEFRNKQIHLAIIVDEWGGTEGIVTIEDILEELVGEIADEYDIDQQNLYTTLPNGGWVVDAKMSIIDIQEELDVRIPLSPEYDTIGGYIFNRAGAIPSKGWRIHHDDFDLEILSSNERAIEKIKITPH